VNRNFREYGAFELKRSYQKNLGLGVIGAGLIHVIVILCLLHIPPVFTEPELQKVIRIRTIAQLMSPPPPPSLSELITEMERASAGTFKPVPDAQERKNAIQKGYYGEIYGMVYDASAQGVAAGSESLGYVEIAVPSKHLLTKIELVETDRFPECIKSVLPHYPESAKKNGIEGEIWLHVLVDKNGKVKEVNVYRKSKTKAGFEEPAVEAAWQWEYRPAICNNEPVAVWIIYVLKFKLEDDYFSQKLETET
jgi:TonB family protein